MNDNISEETVSNGSDSSEKNKNNDKNNKNKENLKKNSEIEDQSGPDH